MSARNVILAVLGLAVVAGGAAYFMMKGTNGSESAAVEPAPAVEESADVVAPPVDETGGAGVSETEGDTINADEAGTVEEPAGEPLDDATGATPDSSDDTLGDLTETGEDSAGAVTDETADSVNAGEESIDETLEESGEATEEPSSEPNL